MLDLAYTALRAELTTLNTADTTSSSSASKSTMDIDSRAGATGVAVAEENLANGDIYLTSTPRLRPQSNSTNTTTCRSLLCK
jgi:hypothetical protein